MTAETNMPMTGNGKHEIAFIDTSVSGYETLLQGVREGVEVVPIGWDEDGVRQLAFALAGRSGVEAVHVFSHGAPGMLQLGTTQLTMGNLAAYSVELAVLRSALSDQGGLLLYGCNIAQGAGGRAFVDALSAEIGAEVAASENPSGSSLLGGDWKLAFQTGEIPTPLALLPAAQHSFSGLLPIASENFDRTPDGESADTFAVGDWTFTAGQTVEIAISDVNNIPANLNNDNGPTDGALLMNWLGATGVTEYSMRSTDSTNFSLASLQMEQAVNAAPTLYVSAYSGGMLVIAPELVNFTTSDSSGNISYTLNGTNVDGRWGTLSFNAAYANVDEIRFSFVPVTGNSDLADDGSNLYLDNIVVNTAVPDNTAPAFSSGTVNGTTLVMSFTEATRLDALHPPATGDFVVMAGGSQVSVNSVFVNGAANTITLTLSTPVAYGAAVTVAYTDPSISNDSSAIQDLVGNDAATFGATAVTNNTADTTPPVFASAAVNGSTLVMSYTEATTLNAANTAGAGAFAVTAGGATVTVSAVSVDANAKTVTLTLAAPVAHGQTVTVAYTDPNVGNDTDAIQDAAGNDAASLSATTVTNNTPDTTAPVFASAAVNGATLVMSYSDSSNLDAGNIPVAGAFAVTAGGSSVSVTGVVVDAAAKTVTLTLASAVAHGQAVTVAYTDPTGGNDTNAIQDAAGNDAASLSATTVTNNTPDTTAPVFASAAVNGATLVMTYTDANNLDASNIPAAGAFAVTAGGSSVSVTGVVVNAAAKTVTLTLASAVAHAEAVTVAYTDPTGGNDTNAIQDAAGNDAASLSATTVTNNTPDTTAPVFASAAVSGATLVMTYTDVNNLDASNIPAAGAFAVTAGGSSVSVTGVVVDAAAKTVTLTLASAVAHGQAVTVAYTDPTGGNDTNAIQDVAGNDAASLSATTVTNNTPDTTGPVFASAAVNGATLVMSYSDSSNLDAGNVPAAGAFAVTAGGSSVSVTGVVVDAAAKTVTLTLASAVAHGQAVTVAYADPTGGNDTNAIQDVAGNDAVSLSATTVTNNTPDTTAPAFASAAVSGTTLVMTYTDANNLDAGNIPAAGAFAVTAGGSSVSVTGAVVDAAAKTVTLTLASAVAHGQAVTVAYTDPTGGNDASAIQDAAGNDAASLSATTVTNNTPDTTAPVFASATVNGATLVMTYTDANNLDAGNIPAAGAFAVTAGGSSVSVTGVVVNAAAKTVTLTLGTAVTSDQTVTVAYTDPTGGNDTNAIQDVAGNDAASLSATTVTNNTLDIAAPVFASAAVSGATLVMTYTDVNNLDASNIPAAGAFAVTAGGSSVSVTGVVVDAAAKTVTLTLASAVAHGQAVTVAYADPTGGNDTSAIQDVAGNDAVSLSATTVTNNTPDTTAPAFASAAVSGTTLVMTYTDANNLDAGNIPAAGAFAVTAGGSSVSVTGVVVDAAAKTVTLTLASAVAHGQAVTVAYTDPTGGNDTSAIQDAAGNDATSLSATTVTNNTPDTTAPVFASAAVSGATLVMTYTDANNLDASNVPAAGAFAVTAGGSSVSVTGVVVNAAAKTVTLTLGTAVTSDQAVTVAYTDPTGGNDTNAIQDVAGNDAASLSATTVTNNTLDIAAPVFASAAVSGATLVMTYTDVNNLDASNIPAAGAFAVTAGGSSVSVTGVVVDAAAKTVTLTLASAVAHGQAVTVAYADPTGGNDTNAIQDVAGNDAASLSATTVTNNTPDTTAPAFASAAVSGATLVMTYTDVNNLDAGNIPAAGAFAVTAGGSSVSVTGVVVDAAAKTVTLTLASAVAHGQAVTVAYTDPTGGNDASAIQDAAGNDAASLSATTVTNNTPDTTAPVFASAAVNGATLVMTYTDASNLDAGNVPAAGAFAVTAGGSSVSVTGVVVNAVAKTVTLTLSAAVGNGQAVTVAYTDPTGGNDANAIQDAAGNDAASLASTAVVNNTPSPGTPPVTGTVDGVPVQTGTVTNPDGSTSQVVTVPVVTPSRVEQVGNNTVADIPLVKDAGGTSLLTVQVPVGVGLQASGGGEAKAAGDSLTDLIREIQAHTTAGSQDQNQLTGGGSGFLDALSSDTPLLVQTIVVTGNGDSSGTPLGIIGQPQATGSVQTALVIDARGLPNGAALELQNVEFAAVIGAATVTGGAGSQHVWGDGASQNIFLGADDDVLHGGAGDDIVGSAGGNDMIYGDEGNDLVFGGEGNDLLDGGTGQDIARFSGRSDGYSLRVVDGKLVMAAQAGSDGTDTVVAVETLRFGGGQSSADDAVLARLYEGLLHRSGSAAEVAYWQDVQARGVSMHDVAAAILGSAESGQLGNPGSTSSHGGFVAGLYQNVLGRSASAEESAYWTGLLDSGVDRATVALGFVNSAEKLATALDLDFNHSDVAVLLRMYHAMFGRAPDEAGLNYWLGVHEQGASLGTIADAFAVSAEAQGLLAQGDNAAFIDQLYQTALERAPSSAEKALLLEQLQQGVFDRGQVLLNVAESGESIAIVGSVNTSLSLL